MASREQLSKNNQNAQVWTNWDTNTESDFKACVKHVFVNLKQLYPDLEFRHQGKVDNSTLVESFHRYAPDHQVSLNGSLIGGSNPDGGVIYVKCKADIWMPVLIGENKHQADNPGNAIERSIKNVSFFKNMLINEHYFPYLLNINGPIVNERKGSLFDRISQDGGFMQVNQVYVRSDPEKPRLRPFTIVLDQEFDYNKVLNFSLTIIKKSIEYLIETKRL
jgi:Restriction endonuclease EcoRI